MEEKESKERQRLAKEFSDLLCASEEISESSTWEESKRLFKESLECRSVGDESFAKKIFEEHVLNLQEKANELEHKLVDELVPELEASVSITSSPNLEDFKASVLEDIGLPPVLDTNVKEQSQVHGPKEAELMELGFEDLTETASEMEEKEGRKRQRLGSSDEIAESSTWEESKQVFEESPDYRSIGDESFAKEIFEEKVLHLLENAKERECKIEEEKEEVKENVPLMLMEAGCRLRARVFPFSIGDWMNFVDSSRSSIKYRGTGVPFLGPHLPLLPEWNSPSKKRIIPGNGYGLSCPTYSSKRSPSHVHKSIFGSYYSTSPDVQVKKQTETMGQGLRKYLSKEKLAYISVLIKRWIRSA